MRAHSLSPGWFASLMLYAAYVAYWRSVPSICCVQMAAMRLRSPSLSKNVPTCELTNSWSIVAFGTAFGFCVVGLM